MMFSVAKVNKKLVIVDGNNEIIYHMPHFVLVTDRNKMQKLADAFNAVDKRCIDAIIEFESANSRIGK